MKQSKFWPKIIGTAFLLHLALVLLSFIEVAIYSYFISPGKDEAFYKAHASTTGPWISAIFGSLFMFFLVKRFIKRFSSQQLTYAIWLPLAYLAIDLIMFFVSGYQFNDFAIPFVLATIPKIVAVALAYFIYTGSYQQDRKLKSI